MVNGIENFKEWFSGYENQYVIIGGTACDLLMHDEGLDFRATKDIDIVLIIESLTAEFCSRFWEYVKTAGYEHINKSTGKPQFYRFSNPSSDEYPKMIELFARKPESLILPEGVNVLHFSSTEEISSLSAILLNDSYYEFLKTGVMLTTEGLPVLKPSHLIPFKIKAWLDLSEAKTTGQQIDSRDIKKHKNDVFRLSVLLAEDIKVNISEAVKNDIEEFILRVSQEPSNLRSLGLKIDLNDLLKILSNIYL